MEGPKNVARNAPLEDPRASPEAQIRQLEALLEGDFVDLSSLCSEIRSWPEFENLAMELTFALGLAARGSPLTVEQSIVLLGTGRLRALTYAWFLLHARGVSAALTGHDVRGAGKSGRSVTEARAGRRASRNRSDDSSAEDLLSEISLLIPRRP